MRQIRIRFSLDGETQTSWWLEITANGETKTYEGLDTPELHRRIQFATTNAIDSLVEEVHG